MRNEGEFRAIAAVLLVLAMAISGHHRRRAEQTGGGRASALQEEGWPLAVGLRGSGLLQLLSVVAWIVDPRLMRWARLGVPRSVRLAGAAIGAASLPLEYWVLRSLGKNITPTISTREDHELVTDGPYRWVRHPLYSVGTLLVVALNLLAANWFTGLNSMAGFLMLMMRLPKEEAKLVERFGDDYREYARRTGRLFPRLG